ncbi:hypothetical protein [Photobacterium damselae]|uniref:hypothetical protein n=1 Tax=Photobacterium damselae TaxID=38293 RepID=UPI001F2BF8B5|nr:hypothetical protein [Photobacterium damselae]UKA04826.1 hypothetical protein IHC89_21525 [Photobacterium damselae subsp. damselae]
MRVRVCDLNNSEVGEFLGALGEQKHKLTNIVFETHVRKLREKGAGVQVKSKEEIDEYLNAL